jgi:hypothetical protein
VIDPATLNWFALVGKQYPFDCFLAGFQQGKGI